MHVGAKDDPRDPRLESEYLRSAGVRVERSHGDPRHVAAVAADDGGQVREQAGGKVQDDDGIGSVRDYQQLFCDGHVLKEICGKNIHIHSFRIT